MLASGPAMAWDVSIGTNFLDGALYVSSWSGPAPTWTTIGQRVRASDVPGPTIPNIWITQAWDPIGETWPAASFEDFQGITQASIFNDDIQLEFWGSAEAFAFGSVSVGDAAGSAVGYDFELIVAPFSTANVFLDDLETFVFVSSDPGDTGNAFAQAKLYSTDVGINDPGGTNMPWASDLYTIAAGDPSVDTQPTFTWPIVNSTGAPVTYTLRFEASVSIFAPEPATGTMLAAGVLVLGGLGRRRTRQR